MIVTDNQAGDERTIWHRMLTYRLGADRVVEERGSGPKIARLDPDRLRLDLMPRERRFRQRNRTTIASVTQPHAVDDRAAL